MSQRRGGVLRRIIVALAWAAALVGVVLIALGAAPHLQLLDRSTAMAAAFIPYGVLVWAFVSGVVLTSRRAAIRALSLVTVGLLVLQVLWTRPYWPHDSPAVLDGNDGLTVMTLNTYYGWADAGELVAEAERARPDVVVLGEITTPGLADLDAAGWTEIFPYTVGQPGRAWESDGLMVFARQPLRRLDSPELSDPAEMVEVDGPAGPVAILAVHVANPWLRFREWRSDHESLQSFVANHAGAPLLVAGDLNAVREHEPMGRLRALGLEDAAEQSGAGWLPTYPAQRLHGALSGLPYPSLIAIDHVLSGPGLVTTHAEAFRVGGTDHQGLVVRIAAADRQ